MSHWWRAARGTLGTGSQETAHGLPAVLRGLTARAQAWLVSYAQLEGTLLPPLTAQVTPRDLPAGDLRVLQVWPHGCCPPDPGPGRRGREEVGHQGRGAQTVGTGGCCRHWHPAAAPGLLRTCPPQAPRYWGPGAAGGTPCAPSLPL